MKFLDFLLNSKLLNLLRTLPAEFRLEVEEKTS